MYEEGFVARSFPISLYSYFGLVVPLFDSRYRRIIKKFHVALTRHARFVLSYLEHFYVMVLEGFYITTFNYCTVHVCVIDELFI